MIIGKYQILTDEGQGNDEIHKSLTLSNQTTLQQQLLIIKIRSKFIQTHQQTM